MGPVTRFHHFHHGLTIMGTCLDVAPQEGRFRVRCRSGDEFEVFVGDTTNYTVLQNLDEVGRDRVLDPESGFDASQPDSLKKLEKYVWPDGLLAVEGIFQEHGEASRFTARRVHLLHSERGRYLFEDTHWWLTQIARMADEWLDDLFKDRRTYQQDDFAELYRTNLNILGLATEDLTDIQECATLSRLIYGLSSAYLLTGAERYYLAAKAGVKYQRETFRMLSHDGKHCFWAYGKKKGRYGTRLAVTSEAPDDAGTIPLYEQIYALAGLTQYYRITADWAVLEDIRRTVRAFNEFYHDDGKHPGWAGTKGYFSHLDYVSMRPDTEALGDNKAKKNWNSVGDHIPAYLVNLLLALEPAPKGRDDIDQVGEFTKVCRALLDETSALIAEHFPDPDESVPFVRERFHADWTPDPTWRWQQDRGIIGHNLKISWNLTRVANYYLGKNEKERADALIEVADRLARDMIDAGVDQIRGGIFDAVERRPSNGLPIEFAWYDTKDFWQQEQAILAYLILYGYTGDESYRDLAREVSAFWNLFFLDHDNRGIYFRVTSDGLPYILGNYINKGGHSISGYHAFELNYLAHIYTRTYLPGENNFTLYFRPDRDCGQRSINVLPDFVKPGDLIVTRIVVNGVERSSVDDDNFQVELAEDELGSEVVVEFAKKGV